MVPRIIIWVLISQTRSMESPPERAPCLSPTRWARRSPTGIAGVMSVELLDRTSPRSGPP